MSQAEAVSIQQRIEAVGAHFSGELSVSAANLTTGETIEVNSSAVLPTASVIKVPILIALLRAVANGDADLDTRMTMTAEERTGGSGVLRLFAGGLQPTVHDVTTIMIAVSDNTATNMIIDLLGGVDVVDRAMVDLGLPGIRLFNRVDFDIINDDASNLGVASTSDLRRLNVLIAEGKAFSPFVSQTAEKIMSTQQYLDQGMRYVLLNPYAGDLGVVADITAATKTGFITGVRVDSGIVRFGPGGGFAYALANRGSSDHTFLPESEGAIANGVIGRALTEYWWPGEPGTAPVVGSPFLDEWS